MNFMSTLDSVSLYDDVTMPVGHMNGEAVVQCRIYAG